MTHFILIDSATRQPVPLPFETVCSCGQSVRVTGFENCFVLVTPHAGLSRLRPSQVGLKIITEVDFMRERGQ